MGVDLQQWRMRVGTFRHHGPRSKLATIGLRIAARLMHVGTRVCLFMLLTICVSSDLTSPVECETSLQVDSRRWLNELLCDSQVRALSVTRVCDVAHFGSLHEQGAIAAAMAVVNDTIRYETNPR